MAAVTDGLASAGSSGSNVDVGGGGTGGALDALSALDTATISAPDVADPAVSTGADPVLEPVADPAAPSEQEQEHESAAESAESNPADAVDDDDLDSPDGPKPDGEDTDAKGVKWLRYREGRINGMRERSKMVLELQKEIPGFSLESARQAFEGHTAAQELMQDFTSGQPESIDNVIGFFAEQSPHSLGLMAMRLPAALEAANPRAYAALVSGLSQRLQTVDPAAYQKMAEDAVFSYLSDLHAKFDGMAASGHPEAGNLLNALNALHWFRTGGRDAQFQPKSAAPPPDPLAQREAAIAAREKALANQDRNAVQSRVTEFDQQVTSSVSSVVESEINSALNPIRDSYKDRPRELKHLERDLRDAIDERVKSTPLWSRQNDAFRNQIRQAVQRGDIATANELRDQLITRHKQLASEVIRAQRKSLIEAGTRKAVAANAAAHAAASASAGQRAPAGGGVARPPSANDLAARVKSDPGGIKDALGLF